MRKIDLIVKIEDEVPQTIITDPNRLRQIVLNLVGNALKFTFKGHILIKISQHDADQKIYQIMVEDTGVGIKEEDKDKLFKLFGKLENTESATINPSGTGLGLNISNKLAKKLGPSTSKGISVDS